MFTFSRINWLAISFVLVLGGCSAASSSEPDPASASLPTHTYSELEDAATNGALSGRLDCLWLENEGIPSRALVFPAGYTTDRDGGDVVLFDDQGREIARTGDRVFVAGVVHDRGFSSCLDSSEAADEPFLVSSVEPCTPEECPEP
jgi:hypothetical protein